MHHLIVTQAFGDYAVGDRITDEDAVADATENHAGQVVRVAGDDPEAPAAEAETPPAKTPAKAPPAPEPEPQADPGAA